MHLKITECITHINDEHVDTADDLNIVMSMYNLIEYSDNYSDTSEHLWQFKRDESPVTNAGSPDNASVDNSSSFKYKSSFIGDSVTVTGNRVSNNVKIAVPLKYLSNVWRTLEIPLINCKVRLKLNWSKNYVMSITANTAFKITNTKLFVPLVTLLNKDNVKLGKLLEEGFERPACWN